MRVVVGLGPQLLDLACLFLTSLALMLDFILELLDLVYQSVSLPRQTTDLGCGLIFFLGLLSELAEHL